MHCCGPHIRPIGCARLADWSWQNSRAQLWFREDDTADGDWPLARVDHRNCKRVVACTVRDGVVDGEAKRPFVALAGLLQRDNGYA